MSTLGGLYATYVQLIPQSEFPTFRPHVTAVLEATKSVLSQRCLRLSLLFAMPQLLQSHTALGTLRQENLTLGDSLSRKRKALASFRLRCRSIADQIRDCEHTFLGFHRTTLSSWYFSASRAVLFTFNIWYLLSMLRPARPSSAVCRKGSRPYPSWNSANGVAEEP